MAFDQNSYPKDLRPLNVARTMVDDPLNALATTSGRNIEGFFANSARDVSSPSSIPIYYPTSVPDAGLVGLGYGNPVPGVAPAWCHQTHAGVNPAIGFGYNPNLGTRVCGNAAADQGSDATRLGFSSNLGIRVGGNAVDHSDEGGDDSSTGKKVKFLCSFGGKILPRPSDGMLRYVGGQTRIISVKRDVSFNDLVQKMQDTYGQPVVIKYQLPEEDLDALVSVSCSDDLENMMDEYEKLIERSSDGSAKLRVFLFSVLELDSSGMVKIGNLHDNGQIYVNAVNGVTDGVGGGITRKESIASVTSTQNSDLSGTDAIDSSRPSGQGDVTGSPSASMLSPRGNSATSHENTPRFACVEPNTTIFTETSAVPMGISIIKSSTSQTSSSQPEFEVERPIPITIQPHHFGFDLQQSGVDIPTPAPYLQAYVGPQQEGNTCVDYLKIPSPMGFSHPHLLETSGSVFPQQHFCDNPAGVTQYVPAVHMTMAPSPSYMTIRPNVMQPLMQSQQTRLDSYPDGNTFVPRVVQIPTGQTCSAYQAQVSPAMIGGYGWHQVSSPENVVSSDGLLSHQQLIFSEKIPRLEDCFMCQKALPHAHSDTLAQGQRGSATSPISDSNSVYHSLHPEDNMRSLPMNRVVVSGALGEGFIEQQGSGARPRVPGQDTQVGKTQPEVVVVPQNLEAQHENERTVLKKVENPDYSRMIAPQGTMGLMCDVQLPYGVFVGNFPQSCQGDAALQHLVPSYQVRQDALLNKPAHRDVPVVGGIPLPTSDHLHHESLKGYPGKLHDSGTKEETIDSCILTDHSRPIDGKIETGHMWPIDGKMENLRVRPPEVLVNNEQNKSAGDKPRNGGILDHKQQQISGREAILDNTCSKPKMVLDANHIKPTEMLPCSYTEVPYPHNVFPVESAQSHILGNYYDNPAFSGVESAYVTDRPTPVTELMDDTLQLQPKMVPDGWEIVSNGNTPKMEDIQDSSKSLFSNQDPWNMRHDTHFPPPRPNKIPLKKGSFGSRDPFGDLCLGNSGALNLEVRPEDGIHQISGNLNKDLSLEHVQSAKGSAEELIKQELQAVAEGVAASVLQSSTPSSSDFSVHERNESSFYANQETEDVEKHQKVIEDSKTKVPEMVNLGFPVSDGIGRLQIIKNSDLEELRELGSGTFGTVYHGKWRGTDVAIKRINDRCFAGKASEQERMRDDFWNEAIKLADLHHPNVVAFYGVVLDGPGGSVATVTEYMVNGSLRNALQKRNLEKRKRLVIAMDVAFGMEYLHGRNIVHFDLKSDNLLVNLRDPQRPICKVGDLGLSKVKCQTLISGGVRGTLPWMAPELLNGSSSLVSEKVDVFSFGIVMWEILTGEEPYADLHYGAIIGGIVSNTLRPPVPESCDLEWKSLMERCWSAETSERPGFTEIANELRSMAAKIPMKGQCQQPHS